MAKRMENGDGELQAMKILRENSVAHSAGVHLTGDVVQQPHDPATGKVLHQRIHERDGVEVLFTRCRHVGPE